MKIKTLCEPAVIDSAFESFFIQAMKMNKVLKAENQKLKQEIELLESKLLAVKIALESVNDL